MIHSYNQPQVNLLDEQTNLQKVEGGKGTSMRHLGRDLEINFCSQPFCIGSVLCTRVYCCCGDINRKIVAKTQMLRIRFIKVEVNGEVDLFISIPFSIVKAMYV